MSITSLPLHDTTTSPTDANGRAAPLSPTHGMTLLAVSTRATRIEIFAWPSVLHRNDSYTSMDRDHSDQAQPPPDSGQANAALNSSAEPEAGQNDLSGDPDSSGGANPSPEPPGKPCHLISLPVPRGSPSAGNQVLWTPVCWLPCGPSSPPTSASATDVSSATATGPERTPGAAVGSETKHSTTAQNVDTWLLSGLSSGGIALWRISVDPSRVSVCPVATCVGPLTTVPPGMPPPRHSLAKQSPSASDGPWRPRSARASASGAAEDASPTPYPPSEGSPDATVSWRRAPATAAATAQQMTVYTPDVHARMLFTLHAFALGSVGCWRVATTSYDRKIASWTLQVDAAAGAARLHPTVTWHGTGSQISAMCTEQVCASIVWPMLPLYSEASAARAFDAAEST